MRPARASGVTSKVSAPTSEITTAWYSASASRSYGNSAAQRSPPICVTAMPSAASAALKAVAPFTHVALVSTSPPAATEVVAAKVSPASKSFIVALTLFD